MDETLVTLPRFRGHRRRLPPAAPLFVDGDFERELLVEQKPQAPPAGSPARERGRGRAAASGAAEQRLRCSVCKAVLPTPHLLDIHISELHDSFFAAQAARRLDVFRCLVEGCQHKFRSAAERKQHLVDAHAFPPDYHFERMHITQKHGQQRPQRAAQPPAKPEMAEGRAASGAPEERQPEGEAEIGGPSVGQLTAHLSRLTTAAETSTDPAYVSFGRGRPPGVVKSTGSRGTSRRAAQA